MIHTNITEQPVLQNINNLAQKTNFILGTSKLPNSILHVQSLNIPSVSVSHIKTIGGRFGTPLAIGADSAEYSEINLEVLLDEDLNIFRELINLMQSQVQPGTGVFEDTYWDFWLQVNNNKGNQLFRIDFIHSRLSSISDIALDSSDDGFNTMSLSIVYDYFKISDGGVAS